MKSKELIKRLKRNGVRITKGRGKGGHVWAEFQNKATIPIHGDKDLDPCFIKTICKQPGIDHRKIL